MLKGVNKNIIEINDRYNENFEKIIIILKDRPAIPDDDELIKNALLMVGKVPVKFNYTNKILTMTMCGLAGAILSLCCCAMVLLFV